MLEELADNGDGDQMPKAYGFTAYGGPENEKFLDLPRPVPGPGQLLIAVHAAGVNPADWKTRAYPPADGQPPQRPVVLGNEVSGVVERFGPGVDGFSAGDAVFGAPVTGGYAEYTLLSVALCAHKPDGLSFVDAATLPVAAATAYDGVKQLALPPGAVLLITGAGGGVGVAAAQIARHAGIAVIGIASASKRDFVESLDVVHIESGPGVADRIRAVAPDGVDAIFDLVGGETLEAVADLLRDRSKLIAASDRATVAKLGGSPVRRTRDRATLDLVAALAVDGVLKPHITATYPLDQADQALRTVEDGHARGKIVIEVVK
jgi:NADPH:quinone reductase-like Zn-dependent oxidoreductase